eukprot:scpid107230/ scgid10657/ 
MHTIVQCCVLFLIRMRGLQAMLVRHSTVSATLCLAWGYGMCTLSMSVCTVSESAVRCTVHIAYESAVDCTVHIAYESTVRFAVHIANECTVRCTVHIAY